MVYSLVARRALLACALLVAVSGVARAQAPDTTSLRLDALLAEATAANPTLQVARLETAARAQVSAQVGSLPDPTASVTVLPYPLATGGGSQRSEWSVMQMMPWPGTLALRERAANFAAETAGYEADALALDLALQVKQAYYTLYRLQRTDALVRSFAERLGAFTEATAVRYEVGRGPQGAVLQVQLERERLRERLLDLDARREAALQTLARLTDRPDLVLAGTLVLEPPPLPGTDAALADVALRLSPEVHALEAAEARAETEVALAEKAFYPDLGLGLMFMDMTGGGMMEMGAGERIASGVGFMVSARIPLQRDRLRAQLEEARLRQAQVNARQAALETAITTQLADLAYAARREAETLALFRDRLLPQAQATVESVLAAYTTGEADYVAFLDAERSRFQVQLGLEEALGRYLDATARLERALGGTALLDLAEGTTNAPALPEDPRLR